MEKYRHYARALCLTLLFGGLAAAPVQAQDTLFVDQSASGANDGTSWSDAYVHLQDAIDEAENLRGQVILVAEGTYYPDEDSDGDHADDDPSESFGPGISIVAPSSQLLGGFPSGGGERDPEAHRTVLSGDITQDDSTTSEGITPTASAINGENSHHVLEITGNATPETIVDGFVITGGQADGSGLENRGGGILNQGSPTLRRLTFAGNSANLSGGGLHNRPGAFQDAANPYVANCTFVGNRAQNGAALTTRSNATDEEASPTVVNTVFSGNTATFLNGGAVFNFGSRGPVRPIYINVTFSENVVQGEGGASKGGAMANQGSSSDAPADVEVRNAVFWGNRAEGPGDQIHNANNVSLAVGHSLLEGGLSAINNEQGASTTDEGGNIDADPQFANPDGEDGSPGTIDDDLRLEGPGSGGGASPAIDVGNGQSLPPDTADIDRDGNVSEDLPIDRFGNPRVQSGTGTATVDMGAHESDGSPLPVELVSFDGTGGESRVRLTWQTATETENARFEVQRRVDKKDSWTTVGVVKGAGTTTEARSYRFADGDLPYEADRLTYRLKQVDVGGTVHYSRTVTVDRGVSEVQLLGTYPNPAHGQATVRYALPETREVSLTLYDALGRQVRTVAKGEQSGRHERKLNTSALPSGVYFLRLRTGRQTRTQKLTVVR